MTPIILIFDFDGTIADTFHHTVKIGNRLASEFKFKAIEWHELDFLKDKTSQEVIAHLKVPVLKIPLIAAKARNEMQKEIGTIEPIKGLKEELLRLKASGAKLGILTSNSAKNVDDFLKNHDLKVFDFINICSKIWGKDRALKNLLKQRGFKAEDVIYIGDETRDIEAAKKVNIRTAAVTWGFNSQKALEALKPDFLMQSPAQLFKLCF